MRLDRQLRAFTYLVFALLFASGALWFVADRSKDPLGGGAWSDVAATVLMVHGGTAMVTLMLIGAIIPLHILRAWRARLNLATGIAIAFFNMVLIGTAFGLYYMGSEDLRPWISLVHLWFGLALPALLLAHVLVGRHLAKKRLRGLAKRGHADMPASRDMRGA